MNPEEPTTGESESPYMVDARARIIWGESTDSVRDLLVSNGLSGAEADAKIKELYAERIQAVKEAGWRKVIIGSAILCGAALVFWFLYDHPSQRFPARRLKVMFFDYFVALYGLCKLAIGLYDVMRPKSEEGAVSDLSD